MDDVVAIGQDLTLVRSLQAAAEHAERLAGIGRLVAGVVHELNNPLTAVNMYSDVLVEKLTHAGHDPADVEKLRAIHEGGAAHPAARPRPRRLRPPGGRAHRAGGPRRACSTRRRASRSPPLKEADAVLEKLFEPVPPIEGSRASLVQVVVNLVTNAAQAVARRRAHHAAPRAGRGRRCG